MVQLYIPLFSLPLSVGGCFLLQWHVIWACDWLIDGTSSSSSSSPHLNSGFTSTHHQVVASSITQTCLPPSSQSSHRSSCCYLHIHAICRLSEYLPRSSQHLALSFPVAHLVNSVPLLQHLGFISYFGQQLTDLSLPLPLL